MTMAAKTARTRDARAFAERLPIDSPSTLRIDNVPVAVQVADLSCGGFSMDTTAALDLGSKIEIGLPGHGSEVARIVRVRPGGYGCEFVTPLSPAALTAAFASDTVVPFPTSLRCMIDLDIAEETPRAPGIVRVSVLLGGVALSWAAVVLSARAIFG